MLPIIQIGDVLVSPDIFTERFCCDISQCKGACCIEGDAGAPVTLDEVAGMEDALDTVWDMLSAGAQGVIDRQGIAYNDRDGELVTSIVGGKDCVFTCYDKDCCLCALEKAYRESKTRFCKPISCALYPIREKHLSNGLTGLNYHSWNICAAARRKGAELDLPVYRFLKEPLTRRFGAEWYEELERTAEELRKAGYIK